MGAKRSTILTFFLLSAVRLSALEWEHINPTLLFGYYNNASIGTGKDALEPSLVQFSLGASIFSYLSNTPAYFQPGLQFCWNRQEIRNGVPRPVGPEAIAHMQVLTLSLDLPVGYLFKIGSLNLGVQTGVVLDMSFPLIKAQRGTAEPGEFWKAYYLTLRVLKLSASSWLEFPVSEKNKVAMGINIIYPLANLWMDAPWEHGMRLNVTVSVPIAISRK